MTFRAATRAVQRPDYRTENLSALHFECSRFSRGVGGRCRAGPLFGVGCRFSPIVSAGVANRPGLLASGHARSAGFLSEGIGSVHIEPGQIAIVQKGDLGWRRRDDFADNGMRHSEADQKPRHLDSRAGAVCIFPVAIVGNGMHSDFAAAAHVPFFRGQEDEGARRVTFPGRVYDETPVANDPCDVDAILKGAAAGRDLNADNRSVLQSRFQPAVISVSHVTAQFENEPGAGLHAFYLEGTGWLKMRNQHEERSQLEYHSRLEEHRASQNAGRTCPFA